jgi:hypothetical protein
MEIKNNINLKYFSLVIILIVINLVSCGAEMGSIVINRPDEYRHTYDAKEVIVLKAIAGVFRDRKMGTNVAINKETQTVETDYIIQGDWRTKSMARVRKLNWKESEVILSVIAEKKTKTGWEMRQFLEKDQYAQLFSTIELRIYEEMAKIE